MQVDEKMRSLIDFSDSTIQAAIIGAVTSFILAVIGGIALLWRLRRDARLAAEQIRMNEVMRLKLKVYEEITPKIESASRDAVELSGFIRTFCSELVVFAASSDPANDYRRMTSRAPRLLELEQRRGASANDLFGAIERWQIIDPRLRLFLKAFSAIFYEITEESAVFFYFAFPKMPTELSTPDHRSVLLPPLAINESDKSETERLSGRFLKALDDFQAYLFDLGVELQNSLLGELFEGRRVATRNPHDPSSIVLSFHSYEASLRRIEEETEGGRKLNLVEAAAKERFAFSPTPPVTG